MSSRNQKLKKLHEAEAIQNTLVQIRTPDSLRGRVAAINSVFIAGDRG
jgi:hypothetical protein